MVHKKQREHLLKLIRKQLKKGEKISIYGWMALNHNDDTRSYVRTKRIQFVEQNSRIAGVSGAFVICTPFISHADFFQIKKKCLSVFNKTVEIRVLKKILRDCEDLIFAEAESGDKGTSILVQDDVNSEIITIEELELRIYQSEVEVDKFDKLASLFKKEINGNKEKAVGSKTLWKILRELDFQETPRDLTAAGWLAPFRSDGKSKIGGYLAGEMLLERMSHDKQEEPSDPIDKALFLRKRRPFWEERKREAQAIVDECNIQLGRCDAAEDLLKKLEDL